jgi:hypothetical protein
MVMSIAAGAGVEAEVVKPWADPRRYQEDRFREALYEAELAERLLQNGLLRNAAGKAYQALKAYAAGLAVSYRDALARYFPERGSRRGDAWRGSAG